jgi:hypothetical protein
MKLVITNPIYMNLYTILQKAYPWIGLVGSLCLVIPSLYNILDDPLKFSTDHIVLVAGIILMIVFLKEIFDRIVNLKGMD